MLLPPVLSGLSMVLSTIQILALAILYVPSNVLVKVFVHGIVRVACPECFPLALLDLNLVLSA